MYIQPKRDPSQELPLTVPRDYSGHTFRVPQEQPPQAPPQEAPPEMQSAPSPTAPQEPPEATTTEQNGDSETAACGARPFEKGFLSRIPFLSSLLPPKRSGKHEGELPEWAIIGLVLLLLTDETGDILPFLLLLVLWD